MMPAPRELQVRRLAELLDRQLAAHGLYLHPAPGLDVIDRMREVAALVIDEWSEITRGEDEP